MIPRSSLVRFAKFVLAGLALGLLVSSTSLQAEPRTLTDKQGRSIKAEIVSVDGDKVTIKREDGQTFSLSLETLSDDDRQFLKEWAKKQASLIPSGTIDLQVSRGKFATTEKETNGHTAYEDKWGYSVTLKNRSMKVIKDLRVRYLLFVKVDAESVKGTQPVPLKRVNGSKVIDVIDGAQTVTFRSDTISMFRYELKPGFIWSGTGSSQPIKDSLVGIWMRVYAGDQLVSEYYNPTTLAKTETWSNSGN